MPNSDRGSRLLSREELRWVVLDRVVVTGIANGLGLGLVTSILDGGRLGIYLRLVHVHFSMHLTGNKLYSWCITLHYR
jgi:hypothetical protein